MEGFLLLLIHSKDTFFLVVLVLLRFLDLVHHGAQQTTGFDMLKDKGGAENGSEQESNRSVPDLHGGWMTFDDDDLSSWTRRRVNHNDVKQ